MFNFAIARIRYRGQTVPAQDVRVFVRLFTTATGLDYQVNGNYPQVRPVRPGDRAAGSGPGWRPDHHPVFRGRAG